jgi:hypothetical protein
MPVPGQYPAELASAPAPAAAGAGVTAVVGPTAAPGLAARPAAASAITPAPDITRLALPPTAQQPTIPEVPPSAAAEQASLLNKILPPGSLSWVPLILVAILGVIVAIWLLWFRQKK